MGLRSAEMIIGSLRGTLLISGVAGSGKCGMAWVYKTLVKFSTFRGGVESAKNCKFATRKKSHLAVLRLGNGGTFSEVVGQAGTPVSMRLVAFLPYLPYLY